MHFGEVHFFVASHTAWAPGIDTDAAWLAWAHGHTSHQDHAAAREPRLSGMPPMLRRRASSTGRMALEAACACLPAQADKMPIVFASRHGECERSVVLLQELVTQVPLSPATFSLSVHNANAGLLSIARGDHSNSVAVAAGASTVEHALIEACGLLADGASQVLLVVADSRPPEDFRAYADCMEEDFAWAWLLQTTPASQPGAHFSLSWSASAPDDEADDLSTTAGHSNAPAPVAAGIDILRFFLRGDAALARQANGRNWHWRRHA